MISINKFYIFLIITTISAENYTVTDSYNYLINRSSNSHPTTHIINLLRSGSEGLNSQEILRLRSLGLNEINGQFKSVLPTDLNQNYETEHFSFHYTNEGNDAVENIDYVIKMSEIYEQVWRFYIDTLGYTPPPINPNSITSSYNVYIQNLPSFYFGITYTEEGDLEGPSCLSFIKMRNNYTGSQFSQKTEIENLKVTAVHEFFHAIQFGYNCYEKFWLMEATAVWSEDKLYDGINDLYRYMPSWFSNPQMSINDGSSHMYGSFIFFQYIDEHLGGANTIKACWDYSNKLATPNQDMSIISVDNALKDQNSSFNEAHIRMRIANLIMTNDLSSSPYTFEEADGYKSVLDEIPFQSIIFEQNNIQTISKIVNEEYSSSYFDIIFDSPIQIELNDEQSNFKLSSIAKVPNQDIWNVRTSNVINIDPSIRFEWVRLVVSINNFDLLNAKNYTLTIKDGYSEDFTLYPPYPNPSFGNKINFKVQVITPQIIKFKIFNILGENVWNEVFLFEEAQIKSIVWNGLNINGQKVSNGVYFLQILGNKKTKTEKVIILKN